MELTPEELQSIIDNAVTKALTKMATKKKELEEVDVTKISDAFHSDEITDEELLFWSTPYYNEIQNKKQKLESKT